LFRPNEPQNCWFSGLPLKRNDDKRAYKKVITPMRTALGNSSKFCLKYKTTSENIPNPKMLIDTSFTTEIGSRLEFGEIIKVVTGPTRIKAVERRRNAN
jgi:hypothetical protein